MKSYVVRIYRGEPDKPASLVGIVEEIGGTGSNRAFTNLEELWEVFNPAGEGDKRAGLPLPAKTD